MHGSDMRLRDQRIANWLWPNAAHGQGGTQMGTDRVALRGWTTVAMLFCFMVINFADKAVLGLSALPIMRELGLDHTQFGLIGASFFALFSISAVVVGFVVNRVSTKWVLVGMALSWALFQLPMALPLGLSALVANRMLLGLGEGPAYPVALHAIYKWFSNLRRAVPTSIIAIGGAVGAGIAAPVIVFVIEHYSWRSAFGVLGLVGLVWCAVWLFVGKEGPLSAEPVVAGASTYERLPYARLLTSRTFVGQALVGFAAYWLVSLSVVWLPAYLTNGAGYTPIETGWIITLPALANILLLPGICAVSEKLKRQGASSRAARGGVACAGLLIAGLLAFALPQVSGPVLPVLCTALAFSCGTSIFSLGHVMIAEITPTAQRGSMLAIGNALATLAGPLAPVLMGMIVDTGVDAVTGFRNGFMLTGAAVAAVAVLAAFLIDPEADRARFAAADLASDHVGAGAVGA
jgi:ACS family D-galactonate transporter-like MFS transporter